MELMGFDIDGCPLGERCLPLELMLKRLPAKNSVTILKQWITPEITTKKTTEKERDLSGRRLSYSIFFD
jgi:hypothetical protein